jgi:hypothetical protein
MNITADFIWKPFFTLPFTITLPKNSMLPVEKSTSRLLQKTGRIETLFLAVESIPSILAIALRPSEECSIFLPIGNFLFFPFIA